jgi:hypothetical protein
MIIISVTMLAVLLTIKTKADNKTALFLNPSELMIIDKGSVARKGMMDFEQDFPNNARLGHSNGMVMLVSSADGVGREVAPSQGWGIGAEEWKEWLRQWEAYKLTDAYKQSRAQRDQV